MVFLAFLDTFFFALFFERGPCRSIKIHQMENLNFPDGLMSTVKRSSLNVHHDVMICDGLSIFSFLALQLFNFCLFFFSIATWAKRQDLIDQHVAYFLRKNPEVGCHGVPVSDGIFIPKMG